MRKKCIICDLDNVYVDSREWNKYTPTKIGDREGWDSFQKYIYLCKPNKKLIKFLIKTITERNLPILFITSRENTKFLKPATIEQISNFSNNKIVIGEFHKLYMRKYADYRPAYKIKEEILVEQVLPEYHPLIAIDDDLENINMFERYGIPSFHYEEFLNA